VKEYFPSWSFINDDGTPYKKYREISKLSGSPSIKEMISDCLQQQFAWECTENIEFDECGARIPIFFNKESKMFSLDYYIGWYTAMAIINAGILLSGR
jgi:hypothetical protein